VFTFWRKITRMIKLPNDYGRKPNEAAAILDAMGGNTAAGRVLGVTPQALSYWRRKGIPPLWIKALRGMKDYKALFPTDKAPKAKPKPPHRCPACGHVGPMEPV
jgi:hypothetical protein